MWLCVRARGWVTRQSLGKEHKQPDFCCTRFRAQFKPVSANPSNGTIQLVLSLPHCTDFRGSVGGEMLYVRSYLAESTA